MEEKKEKKIGLAGMIFIAMLLGILFGAFMWKVGKADIVTAYINPFGTIFVNLLKFIVVPVVLLSMIGGMISMNDVKKVGSIGWKTVVYYMVTTAIAILIGLIMANLFKGYFPLLDTAGAEYEAKASNVMDTIVNIFPSNMWASFTNANMLQVIVIAILIGVGILLSGEKGEPVAKLVESANAVFTEVMMFILKLTPIGVFCLMSNTVAVNGPSIISSLAIVIGVAYLGYILHLVIVYSVAVKAMGGLSPWEFFKGMAPAMIFAFTSASSVATLPLNIECSENLGADKNISSFVLPLGATINMDGTAIYMGVTSIFIACCYGMDLTLGQMATIVLTATLASIGTAGMPGAGMIMLTMVLQSVGLPVAGVGLIMGVDKLFDMGRTCLNITGDASCAIVVTHWERKKQERLAKKA